MITLLPGLSIALSGALGFDMSDRFDCTAYLFQTGSGWVLFDAGAGRSALPELDGPGHVLLTHAHLDHSGGAAACRAAGAMIVAGAATAALVAAGDEAGISLDVARAAGIYPADYTFAACQVDRVMADGETVVLADLRITALATPGHSRDHLSYLVETAGYRALLAGDAVFHGGRVSLQNTYDCDVPALCTSLRRLGDIAFDVFLPGHGPFSLARGRRHVDAAIAFADRLLVPPSL